MCPCVTKCYCLKERPSDRFHLYKLPAAQDLRTRETVRTVTASLLRSCRSHTHMADRIRFFDRYSNTLLVSLNNRIAIRRV